MSSQHQRERKEHFRYGDSTYEIGDWCKKSPLDEEDSRCSESERDGAKDLEVRKDCSTRLRRQAAFYEDVGDD